MFENDLRAIKGIETSKKSETFLRQVIENAAGVPFKLIFGSSLGTGRYTYVGDGIKDLLGISPADFTEKMFNDLVEEFIPLLPNIPVDPLECRKKIIDGSLKQYKADVRIKTVQGEQKWLNDSSMPLRDERSGKVIGALGILMDITQRRKMEEALRESEQRFRSLFDGMMDGVYQSTHEGRFLDVNPAMVKMFGYVSKEEMLKVDIKKELYFAPSDRDSLFLDTGQERTEVFLMRRKNGSEIWVEDHGHYVHDEQGRVIFHEGILRDVTERRRTDLLQNAIYEISQAPNKSATLDDLFKAVHDIISTVMPAKNFYISLYDHENDMISFPYFIDEVDVTMSPSKPGKGLTAYVLRTSRSLLCDEEADKELRRRGEVNLIGAPSAIWVGVPLIIGEKAIGVMVVQHYTDPNAYSMRELHMLEYVSSQVAKAIEHKRAEDRLRQSEEQFRLISENVEDMIALLDLDGKRLYNSPSYKNVLGDPLSLHGSNSFKEIHPDDREKIKKNFEEIVRTGLSQRAEYRFVLPDGSVRHVEAQGSAIKDSDGNISNILVVSRDITEKKKLEQQFLRSQRMESIGTLAGGIAHDLNNVLAPIMLSIQLLQKRMKDPDVARILDTLSMSAKRGSDVVKQVLAFSRGIEGERSSIIANHIISEVVKITKETFPRSIEIRSDVPKSLWSLSADPTQIHQVLLNIFVNARDAMPYGGKISITADNVVLDENYARMNLEAKPGEYVRISVSDTGKGIPPKILDKIFEPFFTTKDLSKGTGLGLSTVLAIVRSHGGFIDVYSEVEKGTTFKIYLPAQIEKHAEVCEEKVPEIPGGHGELILIVDDEPPIREITRDTLEAHGYNVLTACDGTEALAHYTQNMGKVDVVITDIMMPILDGPATIRALRKINPNVKIIAASGLVPNADLMKNSGMVREFLTKPYTAEKLLKSLHTVLTTAE